MIPRIFAAAACLLSAMTIAHLTAADGTAEGSVLTNGELRCVGGAVAGWRISDGQLALSESDTNLPQGLAHCLVFTAPAADGNHGWLGQQVNITPESPKRWLVSAMVTSSNNGSAYLQVKRYANKKEIDRVTIGASTTAWNRIEGVVDCGDADRIEVLCRWRGEGAHAGSTIRFGDVKLMPVGSISVVALVGDSTVQDYPTDGDKRGWGQTLAKFCAPNIVLRNCAAGGRSTSTFRSEGRWDQVLALKPSLILLQFGHNDSHDATRPEATDAATTFRDNLRRYVTEARAAGIPIILVTPPPRRHLTADGLVSPPLIPYAESTRLVAKEMTVPCIDLFAEFGAELSKRGDDGSIPLYCSQKDRSHFSEEGADMLAHIVATALKNQGEATASLLRPSDTWPAHQ
jgi:lysophospholipase L1-like esterase